MSNEDILQLKIDQVGVAARDYAKAVAEMMVFAGSCNRKCEPTSINNRSKPKRNFTPGQIAFIQFIDGRISDVVVDGTVGEDLAISSRDGGLISTKYPKELVFHTIAELYAFQNEKRSRPNTE